MQGVTQEQGVTTQGLKALKPGGCPTRYVLGERVMHSKSKKQGVIVEIAVGEGTSKTHDYGVVFDGTVVQVRRGVGTLRPPVENGNLTASLKTSRDVFHSIASCMDTPTQPEEAVLDTDHAAMRRRRAKRRRYPQCHTLGTSG